MRAAKAKSVFETVTGKSSLIVILTGLITIITPHYCDYLKRHTTVDHRDIDSAQRLMFELIGFLTLGGGYSSLVGRASTTPAYSPHYMSGLSKEELEKKIEEAVPTETQEE